MKVQKINGSLWSVTAPNGNYAHLAKYFDGWEVSVWTADHKLIKHGSIHQMRFNAKVEAMRILDETT